MSFTHAKTFETRWGIGLAYIDLDDNDCETLRFQLWAPMGEDGEDARVNMNLSIPPTVNDEAYDVWVANMRTALDNMDYAKFEEAFVVAGLGATLDNAFGLI